MREIIDLTEENPITIRQIENRTASVALPRRLDRIQEVQLLSAGQPFVCSIKQLSLVF